MGIQDKFENAADENIGEAKQFVGRVTDDPELEAEGAVQKAEGGLKQAWQKVKDAFG